MDQKRLSRRAFLRGGAAVLGLMGLAACGGEESTPMPTPPQPTATPAPPTPAPAPTATALSATPSLRILWTGDSHGQLRPIYHREIYDGDFLATYGLEPGSPEAYCCSHVDFLELALRYGKIGGFAHLATLIEQERSPFPERTLLLDAGDSWYGSAIAYLTDGQANVQVMNALGYDAMTMHWEFNLGPDVLLARIDEAEFPVLAQNLVDMDFGDRVLTPSFVKTVDGTRVAVVGQAYPFSLLTTEDRDAHPDWRMGYQDAALQEEIDRVRAEEEANIVILLSHMGYLQDKAMAERLTGIDVIVGGHTHDILWQPEQVGQTLLLQGGSHGKFLGKLDLSIENGRIAGYQHRLLPVLADQIEADAEIERLIDSLYAPFEEDLQQVIGETQSVLYRRSLTGGSTDAFLARTYREILQADLGCAPGWRFGSTILPGEIRVEDVYNAMKPTPSPIYRSQFNGRTLRTLLEDNLDNVFNPNPLQRLGGDMNRCAGMKGDLQPAAPRGERATNLMLNGAPLDDEKVYQIANSGGRAHYLDAESTATERPAVEALIDYIRQQSEPIAAEPVDVFQFQAS
jgi:sulfur-oxidizing protein SoxB